MQNLAQQIAALAAQGLEIKTVAGTPVVVLAEGQTVTDLEQLLPQPSRKQGNIQVQDVYGFLEVWQIHQNPAAVIYADCDKGIFRTVFNDHTANGAGWRDHTCEYRCPQSRQWQEWKQYDGEKMNQEQFAQFIERNLPDIVEPASASMLEISRELVAKKSVSFSSAVRLSNGSNQFTYDEDIKGSTRSGKLEVPETFKIGIPVFKNGQPYAIEARLRYRIKERNLEMWYELIRADDVFDDALKGVAKVIAEETGQTLINADC